MNTTYRLPWSKEVKWITLICLLAFVFALTVGFLGLSRTFSDPNSSWVLKVLKTIYPLSLLFCIGDSVYHSPRSYQIAEDGLHLRRIGSTKIFSSEEYEIDTETNYQGLLGEHWRVFGVGGFFGHLGNFRRIDKEGGMRIRQSSFFYITDRKAPTIRLRNRKTGKYIYINKGIAQ